MNIIFWFSMVMVFYVYLGYPLIMAVLAFLKKDLPPFPLEKLPTVSLVIAAYNEEKVIQEKIRNSLALDYPKDLLEIIVASDGSSDQTNEMVEAYADQGVILKKVTPRGGKTRAMNRVIPETQGDILVLSDANAMYRPDALRKLVLHFQDPCVGAVSGDVRLVNAAGEFAESEGTYYKYERWLQTMESRVGSLIGADGGMYAVARKAFVPPSDRIIVDDFVISMNVARQGLRVIYEPEAVAVEQGTLSSREEFRRKIRIVAGGIQACKMGEGLPRINQPLLLFCYISHKLLRWCIPLFLVLIFISSSTLIQEPLFLFMVAGQIFFYSLAYGYANNVFNWKHFHWLGIPYYFCPDDGPSYHDGHTDQWIGP